MEAAEAEGALTLHDGAAPRAAELAAKLKAAARHALNASAHATRVDAADGLERILVEAVRGLGVGEGARVAMGAR